MLFGAHVSSSGGIHTAIDRAEGFGCDAVQVFTQSPRAWRPTNHKPESFERFKERRAETGIGAVVCHALYLVNLASPDDELYRKSVDSLRNTIEVACAIDADAVVFHIGSHLGAGFDAGLERVCAAAGGPGLTAVAAALGLVAVWLIPDNARDGRWVQPRRRQCAE